MIPKIIHQTAPSNRDRWPDTWSMCQASVWNVFHDYEYRMWTDEDLEALIRARYPWFLETFLAYPSPIFRADAARYFILYEYGGIYIDMDMEVLSDFYPRLSAQRPSIVESPFPNNEKMQNSLMASPPRHPFWLHVMREMAAVADHFQSSVLDATGPRMLDRVIADHGDIFILNKMEFNPPPLDRVYHTQRWMVDHPFTRHHCTASWRE